MQCANEILSQRSSFHKCLFCHHTQGYITCCHVLHILYIRFSNDFPEKQQYLRLSVCERIAFDVIAIIVEIDGEPAA